MTFHGPIVVASRVELEVRVVRVKEGRGKKSALMMVQETVKEAANTKVEISAHHVPCAFYSCIHISIPPYRLFTPVLHRFTTSIPRPGREGEPDTSVHTYVDAGLVIGRLAKTVQNLSLAVYDLVGWGRTMKKRVKDRPKLMNSTHRKPGLTTPRLPPVCD